MKKTTIDSKDFENIDKDLLYLRLEKKELECLNRKTMTRKEQITVVKEMILEAVADGSMTKRCATAIMNAYDAILALPIDVPGDEEIQKYVTDRFSESHLLPEIIAFRAIKYYQQGMPPVSGRKCCLDESEGKQ